MEERQYGTIKIHLGELIKERDISKNRLSQRAEMQRTQLNHYCNNDITRLDTAVLAKLCTVLECEIGDLLEFVPAGNVHTDSTSDES
ncbi:MAG: helix-turn-helix transcriptional regulator [Lachnospiraceae bacterium]|nr:helix-turn-helix transcriptional regulator [Lachnospiraceae bacterium]